MKIGFCELADVAGCSGTVVVIDVLRAFTTAAVGLAAGVASWELVGTVDEARARRAERPGTLLLGEDGKVPPDFDLGNSPTILAATDVAGRPVVHRSSAGTQGVVRARAADRILVTSFAVAEATSRAVAGDEEVWFCVTGRHSGRDGEEDRACGEYVAALLASGGGHVDPGPYVERVATSTAAGFFRQGDPDLPAADLPFSQVVDRYPFAMQVQRFEGRFLLQRVHDR